jgi:hypothetical protein
VNFTEMPRVQLVPSQDGLKPSRTEKAQVGARCLLKEIIPQFAVPVSIGLNYGPVFVTDVVKLMAKGLGITWKLHIAYCPQSSEKSGMYE